MSFIRPILERLAREPVLLRNAVGGIVAIVAVFGITVQDGALDPVIDVLGLVIGFLVSASARQRVTPV